MLSGSLDNKFRQLKLFLTRFIHAIYRCRWYGDFKYEILPLYYLKYKDYKIAASFASQIWNNDPFSFTFIEFDVNVWQF